MEHLTRNTNNDRIVYTIESIKRENKDILSKELQTLIDKVVNIFTGILSSLLSGTLLSILKNENSIYFSTPILIVFFIICFFFLWYVSAKFILPFFLNLLYRKKIDITPEGNEVSVKKFNTEIMQKVSEVNEIIDVINDTDIAECKRLNYVLSLYKLQEIVNFLYDIFVINKTKMRKSTNDGSVETFRYAFNIYTVSAVLNTVIQIRNKMQCLLVDTDLSSLDGYELMKSDLEQISKKLDKIKIN